MKNYIKKIKLETVQAELETDLAINKIAIGFDVAQYNTGIAIIKTTDNYLFLEHTCKITVPKLPKFATIKQWLDNIDLFTVQLNELKTDIVKKYKLDYTIIEDCFMGNNVKTLKSLARHSILVYDRFKEISKNIILRLPVPSRNKINFTKSNKQIKGVYLKKEIMNYVNNALSTEIKDNDIGDACVLALSGLVEDE